MDAKSFFFLVDKLRAAQKEYKRNPDEPQRLITLELEFEIDCELARVKAIKAGQDPKPILKKIANEYLKK